MTTDYTTAQAVALNTFLSYWPDGMPYAEILEELYSEEETSVIDALGNFEDLSPSHLAQLITSLHDQLISVYGD
jgi:flagellar motor switch protein FliG